MKKIILLFIILTGNVVFSQITKNQIVIESNFSFEETVNRLKHAFEENKLTLFAEIEHSTLAEKAQLSMDKATLLIVGNPEKGTLLMQENIHLAAELPLKVLVFEQKKQIFVSYKPIFPLKKAYKLKRNTELLKKIDDSMLKLIEKTI